MNSWLSISFIIINFIFGIITKNILKKKGYTNGLLGFCIGFFLNIIGVVIALLLDDKNYKIKPIEINLNRTDGNVEPELSEIEKTRTDKYEELEKVYELKEKGILTEEEFQVEKEKILNEIEVKSETESESVKGVKVNEQMKN